MTTSEVILREITNEEIERVAAAITNTYPDIDLYRYAIENIRQNVRDQLTGLSIVDDPSYVDELIEEVRESYVLSKVPNEVFKGIQTSHVLGQFATQTVLHAKRGQGGTKTFVSAFDMIKEYVKFKAELKENIVYTYLKQKVGYEHAHRLYVPMFTQVNLSQIVTSYIMYDLNVSRPDLTWYKNYYDYGGAAPRYNRVFIRLTLDRYLLYEMKISMDTLVSTLERSSDGIFTVVPAPTYRGIIDIYPNIDKLSKSKQFTKQVGERLDNLPSNEKDQMLAKLFLAGTFIPSMAHIQVSGIAGVHYVQPVRLSISSVLKSERQIGDDMWEIVWDQITATNRGITAEEVMDLFRVIDIEPIQFDHIPDRLFIIGWIYPGTPLGMIKSIELASAFREEERILPNDETTDSTDGSRWIISYDADSIPNRTDIDTVFNGIYGATVTHLTTAEGLPDNRVQIDEWTLSDSPMNALAVLVDQFQDADELVYLELNSLNFADIMSHDRVDARRTITNNPRNVLNTLGIEALRNVMIVNIGRLLEQSGSEFNFRHIELLVDHFTMHGYVTPVSIIGVEGQRLGPFTESTFQEGDKILLKAAQFGRTDDINTPSAYITIGKRGAYGRDYSESLGRPISRDAEENAIYTRYRQENLTTNYVHNDLTVFSEYEIVADTIASRMVSPNEFLTLFGETRDMAEMPPTLTANDIAHTLQYTDRAPNTPSLHIGQRKLFISELQFLTRYIDQADIVLYAGAAPGDHIGFLASLFPELVFILVDPNPYRIYVEDSYNVSVSTISTVKQLLDILVMNLDEASNIYTMQSLFTQEIAEGIADVLDAMTDENRIEILFISDIRTASGEGGMTTDFDIIWNLAQQYRWIYTMIPKASLVKFRHPFYNGDPEQSVAEFNRLLKSNAQAREDIESALSFEDGLAIDFVQNYRDGRLQYFTGTINLQAWSGMYSAETRLETTGQTVSTYSDDYEDRLFYYNAIDRPYIYHENTNSSEELGFDHCNDCSIENRAWTDFIAAKGLGEQTTVQSLVQQLSGPPTNSRRLLFGNHGKFFTNPINIDIVRDSIRE